MTTINIYFIFPSNIVQSWRDENMFSKQFPIQFQFGPLTTFDPENVFIISFKEP